MSAAVEVPVDLHFHRFLISRYRLPCNKAELLKTRQIRKHDAILAVVPPRSSCFSGRASDVAPSARQELGRQRSAARRAPSAEAAATAAAPAFPHPDETGLRRTGGRDNHWSITSVGRTRPQNILLMEPVSNPSCLVWQLGRGRPPGLSLVNQNNPYLTEREVRATKSADLPGCKVYSP